MAKQTKTVHNSILFHCLPVLYLVHASSDILRHYVLYKDPLILEIPEAFNIQVSHV